ncbi:4a-hydroxytetrahydrobiopterin dehydratase [Pseudooceanicola sp. CBS1P-1]|uniref:Putative pterin-4-alpha-carbinolamine dehydratase n=1 Tax=Pseudooceanicola albus TaxID=2692189 RepID=A0A6L7G6R1_9RHOB|nr:MULTISPECIES: 4a-hydroxytetrahydrobiopterin dehydratase [Pseudooceanicola]MBT9384126.1 4a-hydroxytetrahydrobiopterin dehydratase [Pseudooceanicola endophyticus]MXN19775.1 4a-hydroxytetrahydrobiopterin dehydratase [Pseudooceanicola albus]
MTELLSPSVRETLFEPLYATGWTYDAETDVLQKDFTFQDFTEAFAFMTRAAMWAEKWDHHPDWSNCYNRVTVALTTHDMGGVTSLDAKLARKMDQLLT